MIEKGESDLKKRTKPNPEKEAEEQAENGAAKDEEERNDYTIKKTTKGSEFYDDFMNQVKQHVIAIPLSLILPPLLHYRLTSTSSSILPIS